MKICTVLFSAKLLPTHPDFGVVDTIVYCWGCLALAPDKKQMVERVKSLATDSHLTIHKMEEFSFLDKPYPTGDLELDSALDSVRKHGRYLMVSRTEIKPWKN